MNFRMHQVGSSRRDDPARVEWAVPRLHGAGPPQRGSPTSEMKFGNPFRRRLVGRAALCGSIILVLFLGIAAMGCRRESAPDGERTPPNPAAPALYSQPAGTASKEIPRTRPAMTNNADWNAVPFYILQTELSPATLVHSKSRSLDLFAGTTNQGLAAPTFIAWATMSGPRTFQRGEKLDVTKMAEGWVLVWWAGAAGWTNWDSPWVVYLQHKPDTMALDDDGLHLEFPREAGDVVLLPLYGYNKPPQQGRDFLAEHGLPAPKVKIKTWEWPKVLTRDPLTRIRYWGAALRELPVYCEESFSVDRARDSVTIRSRFQRRTIQDDWKTRHIKLAPISPPLAHAAKLGGFPVTFSKPWFDMEMPTPYGPYLAVEASDEFAATFSVLQYVNETEAVDASATNAHPSIPLALSKLRQAARQKFIGPGMSQNEDNLCQTIAEAGWHARTLPYLDGVERSNTLVRLRNFLRDEVLVENRFKLQEQPNGSGNQRLVLECKGAEPGDSGASLLETLWAYAHFSGDWTLVRERWPLMKTLFTASSRMTWAGFGSDGVVAIGDQAAAFAAFARLAYQAGDVDSHSYGCFLFARELSHLFLKQRGAEYFRKHQPWHSMEFMDEEVFLTSLERGANGWRMDGPKFPAAAGRKEFDERWARFKDADVARFHRDYLKEDARRELNWLQRRWPAERRWRNDPFGLPSLMQLRSLLLNETPAELAAVTTPDQFSDDAGGMANCLSILRAAGPTRYQRLIPPGEPSPFVAGLEREIASAESSLLVSIQHREAGVTNMVTWPRLIWSSWKAPDGSPWSFGEIRPVRDVRPRGVRQVPLNWNTRVTVFELP